MSNIYQAKGKTIEEQFRDVGKLFGLTIRKSVNKIAKKRSKKMQIRRKVAEKCLENLATKIVANEFLSCLDCWAQGAEITLGQAMWLMSDNLSGCQTLMVRYGCGMALLHTEEDFENMPAHMTGEYVVSFNDNEQTSSCITYNDLMPGAGLYGWKRDMIVAVDTLYLKEDGVDQVESPLLANVVAWMVWRMKPGTASPEAVLEMIKQLGVLIDGYAINVVRKTEEGISGYKLTLARDESVIEIVGNMPGQYLRQVNIVDPRYANITQSLPARQMWRGGYKHFLLRLNQLDKDVNKYKPFIEQKMEHIETRDVHTKIQGKIFGEHAVAYINPDVGAVCVGLVDTSTSVSVKLNVGIKSEGIDYFEEL